MGARKRPSVPPTDPAQMIAAAIGGEGAPPAGDRVADDFADAMNDERLQDEDENIDERDDEAIEDEGPQPPMDHIDQADVRVRGDVVPFVAAPMLRMGRVNSQVPTINVYKKGVDGKLVCVGDAPIGIGPQEFFQRFYNVMPRPGESPAHFLAIGVNASGQEVSQSENLPIIDPHHTYLQQLRAQGFNPAGQAMQSFGGIPGMNSLQDVVQVVDAATAPERARLEARAAADKAELEAKEKRLAAELADVRAARAAADAALHAHQESLVKLSLENAREQVKMADNANRSQLEAVRTTSDGAVAMAVKLSETTAEIHRSAAVTAKAEAEAKVQQARTEADERIRDSNRRQELEIARMKNDTDLQIARAQAASAEAIARINADSAARVAEAQALYKMREATAGINANSPQTLITQVMDGLKMFGTNPKDALKALSGGSDMEMVGPMVAELGEVLGKAVDSIGLTAAAYMAEQTKRQELALREKEFELRKAQGAGGGYVPPPGFAGQPQPAGLLAMNQFPPPVLNGQGQGQPQPVLTPVQQPTTAGPQVQGQPAAPAPAASTLSLPDMKAARLTASAIVDSLRQTPRERWVGIAADMLGRVPPLVQFMRERSLVVVLTDAGAPPPMIAGLLEDLQKPQHAGAIPADIPRGSL